MSLRLHTSIMTMIRAPLVHFLMIGATVVSLRPSWSRIMVRVAGSWVAVVGMLMFGWLVRDAT